MTPLMRNILALFVAALISYIIGTALSTIFVLRAIPADIPLGTYASTIFGDLKGQKAYFAVIMIGFIVAFPIAAILRKYLTKIAKLGYPLAGAVAIGTALGLMYLKYETVPFSGARSTLGFIAQLITGAIGGAVFARLQKPLK